MKIPRELKPRVRILMERSIPECNWYVVLLRRPAAVPVFTDSFIMTFERAYNSWLAEAFRYSQNIENYPHSAKLAEMYCNLHLKEKTLSRSK